ncbi:hypothetical protein Angca_008541 [Angiostrongylus cantonensis]|nr:hypothetical protein Angca_008541 [Angiostrongylus cantonensis]
MKEIYLKQLVPYGFVNNVSSESAISTLNGRVDALQNQVTVLTSERDKLLLTNEELSRHYEICRLEFVSAREKLTEELSEAVSARDAALSHIKELQDDVCVLQKELHVNWSTSSANAERCGATVVNCTDEDINRKVHEAMEKTNAEWQKKFDEEGKLVDTMIKEKDQLIFEREQKLSEVEMRLRLMGERLEEVRTNSSDMLLLSEQLQNEKATVSRALAQNRELKEQLIETESRFVALTEEKLQSELARQTAEHQVKELLVLLDKYVSQHANNTCMVLEFVLHPSTSLEPSISTEEWDISEHGNSGSVTEASRKREHILETRLEMANQELEEIRADLRRSHTRNEEMNQILRQNAEDENQNSIHVELGQAVARIHELASENQQLRESIERMVEDRSHFENSLLERSETADVGNSGGIELMNCTSSWDLIKAQSSSIDGPSGIGSENWARCELEKRFAQAMHSNAELHEKLDTLEHINLQLQLENDTIADHVVLYQHQRRLIRERLRVKDKQLAAMEADKVETLKRCQELQKALMDVLVRSGALKEYEICNGTHSSSSQSPTKRVGRTYSHSTVDELSGYEDVVVNGLNTEIPLQSDLNCTDENISSGDGQSRSASPMHHSAKCVQKAQRSVTPPSVLETDAAVHKILQIITEISKPLHRSAVDRLHCTQCIGSLQTL